MVERDNIKTASPAQNSADTCTHNKKYWYIHGKAYDFSTFVNQHPGGKEMILLGRGRECTELFESVHVLSSDKPKALLAKYEVKENPLDVEPLDASAPVIGDSSQLFEWKEDGFYSTVTKRVKEYFVKNNLTYKATWTFYVKIFAMLAVYLTCLIMGFSKGSILLIMLAGIVGEQLHFCAMHDGSHGAISKKPWINTVASTITYWYFFDAWVWLRHHVYAHHCYTGIYRKDPDLTNSKLFLRKHHEASWKPIYRFQHFVVWVWMMLLPNQHWGQALVYQLSKYKKKVFGVPLEVKPKRVLKYVLMNTSFFLHFIFPLFFISFKMMILLNLILWSIIGISYFLVVLPNHDTADVMTTIVAPSKDNKMDWGELQCRNTSNHSIDSGLISKIVTVLYGGMNFQIEHHLFPAVSHEHYSSIAPIVQQTCKEFNIPYHAKSNWFSACASYYDMLKSMAKKPEKKKD
jgi:fatty acid desaturase